MQHQGRNINLPCQSAFYKKWNERVPKLVSIKWMPKVKINFIQKLGNNRKRPEIRIHPELLIFLNILGPFHWPQAYLWCDPRKRTFRNSIFLLMAVCCKEKDDMPNIWKKKSNENIAEWQFSLVFRICNCEKIISW